MTLSAIFIATPEALAAALQLPEGACIDAVEAPCDQPGVLRLRIRGMGYEVAPGYLIPEVRPTITQHYEDHVLRRITIDWGLPKDAAS